MTTDREPHGMDDLPRPSAPSALLAWEYWFKPEKFMERCAKLGDRFVLPLPGLPTLVCISSPEDNRRVFAGDQTALHFGEGLMKMAPHEVILGPTSITVKDDDEHLADRRMLGPHFSARAVKTYSPTFKKMTREAMSQWPLGKPFSFHEAMMSLALDIIIDVVFGVTDARRAKRIKQATQDLVDVIGGTPFLLSSIIAMARGGKWDGKYKKLKRCIENLDAICLEEFQERRSAGTYDREDMLNIFLKIQLEDPDRMPDQAIHEALRTLLIGGYETTASTLGWIGERLVRSPDVVKSLEVAVDAGDDAYLEAVISEGLRTRPNLPHTVRYVVKPFDMGEGLVIPPGCMILPMMQLCHNRPDIYPEPNRFNPQRFLEKKATQYELINFGGGLRRCLGAPFALLEMREIIREIVKELHFEFTSEQPEKVVHRSITLVPGNGAQVVFSKRASERKVA